MAWPSLAALLAGGLLYAWLSRGGGAPDRSLWLARAAVLFSGLAAIFLIVQYADTPALDKVALISRLTGWIGQLTPRLVHWTPQANSIAAFLEGPLFLAAALVFIEKKPAWRWASAAALGMISLGLLLSESRGAWLAVALAGLVWLAVRYRWARWLALLTGLAGAALVLIVLISGDIQILDRIPLVDRTLAPLFIRPDRLDVYQGSLYLIQDMPFSGIGLGGQFAMVYSRFVLLIQVPFLTYSHNLFVETWLELGLAGFLAWIWLLAGLGWPAAAAAKSGRDLLYESSWVGLLAIALHGLTDARPYVDLWCWLPFFFLLGLNAFLYLRKNPEKTKARFDHGAFILHRFRLVVPRRGRAPGSGGLAGRPGQPQTDPCGIGSQPERGPALRPELRRGTPVPAVHLGQRHPAQRPSAPGVDLHPGDALYGRG